MSCVVCTSPLKSLGLLSSKSHAAAELSIVGAGPVVLGADVSAPFTLEGSADVTAGAGSATGSVVPGVALAMLSVGLYWSVGVVGKLDNVVMEDCKETAILLCRCGFPIYIDGVVFRLLIAA
jgi:hypothetical protein